MITDQFKSYEEKILAKLNISYSGLYLCELYTINTGFYARPRNLVTCVFKKINNNHFISEKIFHSLSGLYDSKDTRRTGNYS